MTNRLSHRVTRWSELPTAALHGQIIELQQKGEDIIDLTIGISNRPIPESGKQAAIHAISTNNVPYTAVSGDSRLKTAIQQKLRKENDISCELGNIIATTGAKQAIFQALYAVTDPGDAVAMVTPYWSAYTQMATMLKLTPVFFELQDIPTLADKKAPSNLKAFLFDLPHNPTGHIFSKAELEAVIAFAKKNNIYIIADESYEKLIYDGRHISLATLDPSFQDHIISIFSVSQTFSMMGWRFGYAVADKEIIQAMQAIQSSITAAPSAVTQAAATAVIGMEDPYEKALLADFTKRRDAMHRDLSSIPWLHCELPESGPYFWCDITELTTDSLQFCTELLKQQKIAVMPGDAFGSPGWIRIAFNVQPSDVLQAAVEKIASFGEHYGKHKAEPVSNPEYAVE